MNKRSTLKQVIKLFVAEKLLKTYDQIDHENPRIFHTHSSILNVYDFDDTLAFTKEQVYIRDKDGNLLKKLNPSEYAVYEKKPNEVSDYQDFKYVSDPDVNKEILNKFKLSLINPHTKETTYILTARGHEAGEWIHNFLKKNKASFEDEHIITLNSNNPSDKSSWIKNKMIELDIPRVHFWDDSLKNIHSVKNLQYDFELNKIFGKELFIICNQVIKK